MKQHGPRHAPALVRALAGERRVLATRRVVAWLGNHDYDAAALIASVLSGIGVEAAWLGSCDLGNQETADEYLIAIDGEDWYLKYYVDEDEMTVVVLSCWWDGAAH